MPPGSSTSRPGSWAASWMQGGPEKTPGPSLLQPSSTRFPTARPIRSGALKIANDISREATRNQRPDYWMENPDPLQNLGEPEPQDRAERQIVKAFVVSVNGRKICTAGIGPDGVLSTIIHWVGGGARRPSEGAFGFRVGGLDSRSNEHVDWDTPAVNVGDVICVHIVETEVVDPEFRPESSQCVSPAQPKLARRVRPDTRRSSDREIDNKPSQRKSRPGPKKVVSPGLLTTPCTRAFQQGKLKRKG